MERRLGANNSLIMLQSPCTHTMQPSVAYHLCMKHATIQLIILLSGDFQ
uniref:Uncharacterized protein MANES_11G096500 n=1 Tax=Rhizophora mucronata TaxID=61149 RepID=A0A2P2QDK2_RHIMU